MTAWSAEHGAPFSLLITEDTHGANSLNYDIVVDDYGTLFVANFEGLLYYDQCTWRHLYTPGISRITKLAKSADGRIWFGGFNVIGYIDANASGQLQIRTLVSDLDNRGVFEVNYITQYGNKIIFHTDQHKIFTYPSKSRLTFPHKCGSMGWSITHDGLLCQNANSPYTHITEKEGLTGDVFSINELNGILYVGTRDGLFTIHSGKAQRIPGMDLACNAIVQCNNKLLAATTGGLYIVGNDGYRQLNNNYTLSVCIDPLTGDYITGETNGVYRNKKNGKRIKLSNNLKVSRLTYEGHKLVMHSIYEDIPNWIDFTDHRSRRWLTDNEGLRLKMISPEEIGAAKPRKNPLSTWLYPLSNIHIDAFFITHDNEVIAGNENGIILFDSNIKDPAIMPHTGQPYIREIVAFNDSVIWGGYAKNTLKPVTSMEGIALPSTCRNLTIRFSTSNNSVISPTQYRYRINRQAWSQWTTDNSVAFKNMRFGSTTLEIQALDHFGRLSGISTVKWYVEFPFYFRWWALCLYIVILICIISAIFRWRTKRLQKEKIKLEETVTERTARLSETLNDLKNTQEALLQMERTATAGKLTRGLIDRILNPINYINNFSSLTLGLTKDIREDIEDWDEDSKEDCMDVLELIDKNLNKIVTHGTNTTRTLRAMEAILDNHVGTLVPENLGAIASQAVMVCEKHYSDIISKCQIKITADLPAEPITVDMDAEAINKVICALMANSIYAVSKKYDEKAYQAEVSLSIAVGEDVVLTIHDNGVGMEDTIKEKIFDPFFTTKPTGDAAGVGLYLVRQIIEEHKAKISASSVMGEYSDFIIVFPKR